MTRPQAVVGGPSHARQETSPTARRTPWLLVAAVLVVALTLRGPIVAVTPVLAGIRDDLRLSESAVGLLITAPVLAFAVISPLAVVVIRRVSAELSVMFTLLGALVGELLRAVPSTSGMVAGTLLIGVSIAVGNVVLPVVIRRDVPPDRAQLVTGAYTATLNVGSVITTLGTAPLAALLGWPLAVATWSILTVAGIGLWGTYVRRSHGRSVKAGSDAGHPTEQNAETVERAAWRLPLTWLLSLAFAAQAFSYYAYTTWLPTYLADAAGTSASGAGALASVFQAWGIVGALAVPLAAGLLGHRATAALVSACWMAMSAGVLIAPGHLGLWLLLGGLAQAGGFVVIFTAIVLAARSSREAAGMSAFVQAFGYVIAASSGPAIGGLRSATHDWTVPFGVLVGVTGLFAVFTLAATTLAHHRDQPR